ncbi:hypothetical protein H0H81_006414 [Sphagnurus paluster]|uniref:Response regulatory domain-containing protein n=1 Tax=Sphagnurus paluster TaxID=117069 RepID=A0A9P7FXN8_9AGAR|nr:hypothetical protein H0H81_006414 [Sphagnurus paluster]
MTTPKLPAVRLPIVNSNGSECITPTGIVLELPQTSKFSVSWPSDTRSATTPPASERANLSFTEGDSESSDGGSLNEHRDPDELRQEATSMGASAPRLQRSPALPPLSRALSMPLPSQLGYLKHPLRSDNVSLSEPVTMNERSLRELSLELADSVQMLIQTMLQVSPPQLLDPAKEQFSACALSVPTPSMSAMLTMMKNLNYISANMSGLVSPGDVDMEESRVGTPAVHTDFDIGEILQSVGDALSGAAAQSGVDLVIYHGDDIGLRHVCVKGDEGGISYALSHIVRQVLATTQPGDSIELGLLVSDPMTNTQDGQSSPTEETPIACTIRISHKYGTSIAPLADGKRCCPSRPRPSFSTVLLQRLLQQIKVTLTPDLPPPKLFVDGRTCDFTLSLDRGSLSVLNTPMVTQFGDEDSTGEPSVEQLILFAEGLKGKRVVLYANAKGSFAQHLSSLLTGWGMDVTHVSPDGEVDGLPNVPPSPTMPMPPPPGLPSTSTYAPKPEFPTSGIPFKDPPSFVFIDDDLAVLKDRLYAFRTEKPYPLNLDPRRRPSLALTHRQRSSPQVPRSVAASTTSVVIVHFTGLGNYKMIKDIVQSVMASHSGSSTPLPEVMIIPKPAGPRRFLTALHTAVTKPVVDPFFTPIATSPGSPGVANGSFFHSYHNSESSNNSKPSPAKTNRPSGSRSNSDRSTKSGTKSGKELPDLTVHHPPPSPLAISENAEYFSEAPVKLGASPSTGLFIQNPEGQATGLFFQPPGKTLRNPSAQSMERDRGQLSMPEQKRRSSRLSLAEPSSPMSFSSLHAAATSPKPAVDAWTAASPSMRAAARKQSTTPPAAASSSSSPTLPSKPSIDTSRAAPPLENIMPQRKGLLRRTAEEGKAQSPSAALASAAKKVKAAADGNIVPPISVLIVDDNPINQTILSTFMKKKKIKYDLANNGQEAVQKWRTGEFHLILMDIQMPVMDGIQATKEIRHLEATNAMAGYPPVTPSSEGHQSPLRTPSDTSTDAKSATSPHRSSVIIVALTASSLDSDRNAALAAGCNDFLTKPVSLLWLNNKIIEWGSIKALQMWAERRPDAISSMSTAQAAQARNVADRLHVPHGRTTPSPSRNVSIRMPAAVSATPVAGLLGSAAVDSYWGPEGSSSLVPPSLHSGLYVR